MLVMAVAIFDQASCTSSYFAVGKTNKNCIEFLPFRCEQAWPKRLGNGK